MPTGQADGQGAPGPDPGTVDPYAPSTRPSHHWFEPLADHMGAAYLRYSFTRRTSAEVDLLVELCGLEPGMSVLDIGCGPGRHVAEFARRGLVATGVDIAARFVEVGAAGAPSGAHFVRGDARCLEAVAWGEVTGGTVGAGAPIGPPFDAVVSMCQGAFGLGSPGPFRGDPNNIAQDEAVLTGAAAVLRPGGRVVLSAFSGYFQVRWLETHDRFDPATGVNHEPTEVLDAEGTVMAADLWTTCYTPRELRMLFERVGFVVERIGVVDLGTNRLVEPDLEHPELMVVARRP
ncbi:MAG: methyltransferase domain-containing protein [Microthrixaceae bacterium]